MPRYIVPGVIIALLLVAFAFRWEAGPCITQFPRAISYTYDRWTGQCWEKAYKSYRDGENPQIIEKAVPIVGISHPRTVKNTLTVIWLCLLLATTLWLYAIVPCNRQEVNAGSQNVSSWRKIANKILVVLGVLFLVYIGLVIVFWAFGIGS